MSQSVQRMSEERHRMRSILADYYGSSETNTQNPLDINSKGFQPPTFVEKLTKENSLKQLIEKEAELEKDIHSLDSEMQTLVYENYNKFILATDTIRQMTTDFKQMEDEMNTLVSKMESLSSFSTEITNRLEPKREEVAQLSNTHSLLKKLQHLYDLPTKLKGALTKRNLGQAVSLYLRSKGVLEQYCEMPAFQGIYSDCMTTLEDVKKEIRNSFDTEEASVELIAESTSLLLKLGEDVDELRTLFLESCDKRLRLEISEMAKEVEIWRNSDENETNVLDLLEFVDLGSNTFVTDLGLTVASYKDLFRDNQRTTDSEKALINFTMALVKSYFDVLEQRFGLHSVNRNQRQENVSILVRSLEKLYNKLQTLGQALPDVDFGRASTDLISKVAKHHCESVLEGLKKTFGKTLDALREEVATSALEEEADQDGSSRIPAMVSKILNAIGKDLKDALATLEPFLDQTLTFATMPYFYIPFCLQNVREGIVVKYLLYIAERSEDFCSDDTQDGRNASGDLLLVLSRMCFDAAASTVQHLLNYTTEQFRVDSRGGNVTPVGTITNSFRTTSLNLVNRFVTIEGDNITSLTEKSIENRDWMGYTEPRAVRPAIKRMVEIIAKIDVRVGSVFEEGTKKDRSSDSSRRTYFGNASRQGRGWSQASTVSNIDSSLLSNIQKLFADRVDLAAPVEFTKVSIVTAIVRTMLKTMLESVRCVTMERFGLQQFQVDCHYLQQYIWRFVSDESIVTTMLDDVMSSALNRCTDPSLLSPAVVESISERTL